MELHLEQHPNQKLYKKVSSLQKVMYGLSLALAAVAVCVSGSDSAALPSSSFGVGPIDIEMDACFCEETLANMLALRERYRELSREEQQPNEMTKPEVSEQRPIQKRQVKITNKPVVPQQWPLVIQLQDDSSLDIYIPSDDPPKEYVINKISRKICKNPAQQLFRLSSKSYFAIVDVDEKVRTGVLLGTPGPIQIAEGSIYSSGKEIFALKALFDLLRHAKSRQSMARSIGSATISFLNHCAFFKIDFDRCEEFGALNASDGVSEEVKKARKSG